jgi:hypothetical protein
VLISVYDKLIDKQKELLHAMSGAELEEQSKKIAQLIASQQEVERKKMEDWFAQRHGHSNAYKFNKNYGDIDTDDILRYTAEDFERLQQNAALWAKLPQQVRDYGEAVIAGRDATEELAEATQAAFTGFSFDSLSQSFLDTLMDMDSSVEDFADGMEKKLQRAILGSLIHEKYAGKIQNLYDRFANANKDGVIDEDEANKLQAANDALAAQLIADRENLVKAFGWESKDESADTSLTGAVKGVTEETASMLGGQMNAIRINQMEATEMLRQQLFHLANIDNNTLAINQNTTYNRYIKDIYDKMTSPGDSLRAQGLS